ncbi:hypothetical protein, partial [Pseudomonas aeruginosa]|uniref:hypothetical protein n=1 Tax=Pseudomonas aeruginosa TaxID=287 RepID=UPI0039E11F92|nr:hypothetical protein [Pseudomonas aeruginosa]
MAGRLRIQFAQMLTLARLLRPRLARQARTEQPGQGEHLRELDPQTTRQLASFAQGQKVTLNTL